MIYYKNSFWASVVSIFGCAYIAVSFDEADPNIFFTIGKMLPGVALILLGGWISKNKEFKKWWKKITDKGYDERIAQDKAFAVKIYKNNPQMRTEKAIAKLNPSAGRYIKNHRAKLKAQAKQNKTKPETDPAQAE